MYISARYLIIDNEMMTALCLAAKSGVDVRIMTPGIPDKKMVFLLTQSYYEQLLEAGVHIYEYQPGFLHAKSFVCDDEIAVVGTNQPGLPQSVSALKMVYGFIKTKLSRTSCLTFRKHSITVIRSVLISVGTETLSYGFSEYSSPVCTFTLTSIG